VSGHDPAVSALRGHVGELAAALMTWGTRDDSQAQPDVRRAANHAMDAVDAALRELHGIRARLVTEIRASDHAAAARTDEWLARMRQPRQEGEDQ
jgi:hypothetical protein